MAKKEKVSSYKKSISFREDVLDYAQEQADMFHGGNLSGYITFLISSNKYGMTMASKSTEAMVAEDKIRDNVNNFKKSDENEAYIDQLLNMK